MHAFKEQGADIVRSVSTSWIVLAGPFTRAEQLRMFIAAVGRIEGVTEMVAEQFRLGELSLHVCYTGNQSLAACLAALPASAPCVQSVTGRVIRLTFEDASRDD